MSFEGDEDRPLKESVLSCLKPLETLEEQNTPGFMPENLRGFTESNTNAVTLEELREKRLPTLPNSPSSVLDEEMTMDTPVPDNEEFEPRSHFSALTTNSTVIEKQPQSHFSEFTVRSIGSPSSTYSSTFDYKSPSLSGNTDRSSFPTSPYHLPSMPETPSMNDGLREQYSLTVADNLEMKPIAREDTSSTHDPPDDFEDRMQGLCIDSPNPPSSSSSIPPASLNVGFQGYKLPEDANSSALTLRKAEPLYREPQYEQSHGDFEMTDATWPDIPQSNPHTTTMQQLMDELSYLGEMIQN